MAQCFFSTVRYYGHSGSQELGHLKLVAFAGAWLFEEFSRADAPYSGFFPLRAPQKAFAPYSGFLPLCAPQKAISPNTVEFSTVLVESWKKY